MRSLALISTLFLLISGACSTKEAPLKPCKAASDCETGMRCQAGKCRKPRKKAKKKTINGNLHFKNQSIPVSHLVSHEPKMDLFIQCRARMEEEKKAGHSGALCYDPKPSKPTSIRIERGDRKALKARRLQIRKDNEGYHFVVEPSGSIYQVLDLAYAPKRDGEIRSGEIIVLSAHETKENALLKSLDENFPGLKRKVINLEAPVPAPSKAPVEKK